MSSSFPLHPRHGGQRPSAPKLKKGQKVRHGEREATIAGAPWANEMIVPDAALGGTYVVVDWLVHVDYGHGPVAVNAALLE